ISLTDMLGDHHDRITFHTRRSSDLILEVQKLVEKHHLNMPEIWIEPGRSLVGEAGTTLYTIGSSKDIPNIRKYLAVDGGMSDNLDRKSTRLNSSHVSTSYAVFCLTN